jgi:hypothetical protein
MNCFAQQFNFLLIKGAIHHVPLNIPRNGTMAEANFLGLILKGVDGYKMMSIGKV